MNAHALNDSRHCVHGGGKSTMVDASNFEKDVQIHSSDSL